MKVLLLTQPMPAAPYIAAISALARGDDPSGVARGHGADAMQRFANCGNFLAA